MSVRSGSVWGRQRCNPPGDCSRKRVDSRKGAEPGNRPAGSGRWCASWSRSSTSIFGFRPCGRCSTVLRNDSWCGRRWSAPPATATAVVTTETGSGTRWKDRPLGLRTCLQMIISLVWAPDGSALVIIYLAFLIQRCANTVQKRKSAFIRVQIHHGGPPRWLIIVYNLEFVHFVIKWKNLKGNP